MVFLNLGHQRLLEEMNQQVVKLLLVEQTMAEKNLMVVTLAQLEVKQELPKIKKVKMQVN